MPDIIQETFSPQPKVNVDDVRDLALRLSNSCKIAGFTSISTMLLSFYHERKHDKQDIAKSLSSIFLKDSQFKESFDEIICLLSALMNSEIDYVSRNASQIVGYLIEEKSFESFTPKPKTSQFITDICSLNPRSASILSKFLKKSDCPPASTLVGDLINRMSPENKSSGSTHVSTTRLLSAIADRCRLKGDSAPLSVRTPSTNESLVLASLDALNSKSSMPRPLDANDIKPKTAIEEDASSDIQVLYCTLRLKQRITETVSDKEFLTWLVSDLSTLLGVDKQHLGFESVEDNGDSCFITFTLKAAGYDTAREVINVLSGSMRSQSGSFYEQIMRSVVLHKLDMSFSPELAMSKFNSPSSFSL